MTSPENDLIVFDGTCIFCSGFARFMARHDHKARFLFVTAQSKTGRALYRQHNPAPDLMETNIVIVDGVAHMKMVAFRTATSTLGWPSRGLTLLGFIPQPMSDWIYDRIACNRYIFGRRACVTPTKGLRGRIVE